MKVIILDGDKQKTPNDIYDFFSKEFDFGPYFGRNADALYDFMIPIDNEYKPLVLEWKNSSVFKNNYPDEFVRLVSVFNRIDKFSDFKEDVFKFNLS
ncbi:barstar family protein [Pectobacterium brasiliense]|uniref:Barstar family protein n=1 Tax=Pectobacterium brasiliense TaxID=180957 RepID=A0AAW9H9A4_9GAMM|nr:barstar family protein [Pectobacterium brasiliense]MBA0219862.1 barstar family protein [Pectobacterium brasiliense]MBN3072998.1 barstar family protein [Pectobacterium brasiliense]MBN3171881.1 barstar family protein [Pectobacterium brasiliense]MDY4380530.1 barstar family protein [Pectobacterium brasiliense]